MPTAPPAHSDTQYPRGYRVQRTEPHNNKKLWLPDYAYRRLLDTSLGGGLVAYQLPPNIPTPSPIHLSTRRRHALACPSNTGPDQDEVATPREGGGRH